MKHLITLFFLIAGILFSNNSISQIDLPFPDSTGAWTIKGGASNFPDPPSYFAFRYYINGDTTINSVNYKKLYRGVPMLDDSVVAYNNLVGVFRNDSLKVYFKNISLSLPEFGFADTNEVLLYDFGMNIGDSILNSDDGWGNKNYLILSSIDTVIINGISLRRWIFNNWWGMYGSTWIEGIGSDIGFFTYFMYFESSVNLACFHELNQDFIFDLGNATSCESVGIIEKETDENIFSISPNPFSDIISVNSRYSGFRIFLFDITGKNLITGTSTSGTILIKTDKLSSGIYLLKIFSDNGEVIKKIIKY